MKTLYLDIFSGISGDMFIGALLDLGVDAHGFEHELEKLGLREYHLHVSRQERGTIAGTKFDVHLADAHEHVKLRPRNSPPFLPRDVQMEFIQPQLLQFMRERGRVHAKIEHGTDEHVAAEAAEDVEVKSFHGSFMEPCCTRRIVTASASTL